MPGQLRIRIRHGITIGQWFDYLLASQREVQQIVHGTPWRIRKFINSKGPSYVIVLDENL
jgi:hypothetical protein